ncbi:hypothetical protein TVAG_427500 [Trichomonas vaginalis G3]|uniref:At4g15545-like C-terminal domain-containing protein n=1 Tax=Trichomonas vaginalis (strain ATCC PRA-98 / G3) TaxID=412133 RepID=A2F669_TRIV3|nr:hypothetical protein TVAGG3_0660460 [Trichomonas vaginalis G3]EAX99586.1 hypothetical protein TVAG_427500 [Trichomonas vaginalis G3]KAI5506463.1 hypothetical protein TVAGG3_0660460 [Trichomonas vaginalis G3]|eukprot:XP_001312516.1 hypothetical protein [Trichomonas vaginalis G3]
MQKELAELQNDFRILNQHNQQLTKKLESLNNAKIKMKEIVTNTPIKTKVNKSDDFIITDSLLEGETEVSFTFTLEDDFIETAKTTVSYNNFTKIMKEFQQFKQKKQSKELTLERTENLFLPEYPELFKQFKDLITLL